MAAVNVSPESFYKGSVAGNAREVTAQARRAVEGGADFIDVGGMSTSPYLNAEVSPEVEASRVREALLAVADVAGGAPVSVDTVRASVADMALRHGATVVNDVSGLKNDPGMARTIVDRGASLLAMAYSSRSSAARPIPRVLAALRVTLEIAERAGIERRSIVLDPGIGFFREEGLGRAFSPQKAMPWFEWDLEVISNLDRLLPLGRPICVGLSRKSFLGRVLDLKTPEDRLPASLAATALAVAKGASLIRAHDVKETVQAVRVAESVIAARRGSGRTS
jgi:dihydropteroate synthase